MMFEVVGGVIVFVVANLIEVHYLILALFRPGFRPTGTL
jgi:hypothetical protein